MPLVPLIAIPARNEEARIAKVIEALGKQTQISLSGVLTVVLVINNSDDRSAKIAYTAAKSFQGVKLHIIETCFSAADAHVGSARRLAMERASFLCSDIARGVILTTDADAQPAPNWVEANLAAINEGADLVGGLIIGDKDEERALGRGFVRRAALQAYYSSLLHRLEALVDPVEHDPWPRHGDHTGASLAIRAEVYRAVGGMPALRFREDLAFVSRVKAANYRVRHAPNVQVQVSARLEGRAPGGMAACLRNWVEAERMGAPIFVEAPELTASRFSSRKMLRSFAHCPDALVRAGFERRRVFCTNGNLLSVGALIEELVPDEPDPVCETPIDRAIARVSEMIADHKDTAYAA